MYTENRMATKYGISGQFALCTVPADLCSALFSFRLSRCLSASVVRGVHSLHPCLAMGLAATAVQSWMSLMRNEIPGLVVHFCRWLASLAFAMANWGQRLGGLTTRIGT